MSSLDNILSKYAADIDDVIKNLLSEAPDFIHGMISYHFGWVDQDFRPANFERGKMFRPTINLLVFEAITGVYREALPVAAAIEMIHNFSLIHDDIEDNDSERRGRPTLWTIWGKPRAINVGDFLYSLAFKSLYQLDSTVFPPERIFSVLRLINEACLALTEGQDLDLRFENVQDVSTEMYVDMVYKKTGALVEAAILSGATLGTGDVDLLQNYGEFARNIGIAFQVRDDMLGIWGDVAKTGKSTANDLRRKKKTLPVIYMLNQATASRKKRLKKCYASLQPLTDPEIEFVRESLEETKAYDYTQRVANDYKARAFSALDRIDLTNQAQSELESIAKFLVNRSY